MLISYSRVWSPLCDIFKSQEIEMQLFSININ